MSASSDRCDTSAAANDAVIAAEEEKPLRKMKGGLILIDLPPPPEDICKVCDPIMETDLRIAIFSTIFCWLPLGVLPVILGFISVYYALKARASKVPEERQMYSRISITISWIGMILFLAVLTAATVILATSGIL